MLDIDAAAADATMVVVHFRDPEAVERLVAGTKEWSVRPSRIVVVDNSGDLDRSKLPGDVHVIDPGSNGGYGTAVNAAWSGVLDRVGAGHLLICTQDVVMAPNALEMLMAAAEAHPRAGIVAPALAYRDAPDTIFSLGGSMSRGGVVTHIGADQPMTSADDHALEYAVDWCDGAVLLIDNRVMREVGGFDPAYFLYVEEVDFAFRAKLAGWSTIVTRRAQAWQQPGDYRTYLRYRNSIYFTRKFRQHLQGWPWFGLLLNDSARWALRKHRFAPLSALLGVLHGLVDHMQVPRWAVRPESQATLRLTAEQRLSS